MSDLSKRYFLVAATVLLLHIVARPNATRSYRNADRNVFIAVLGKVITAIDGRISYFAEPDDMKTAIGISQFSNFPVGEGPRSGYGQHETRRTPHSLRGKDLIGRLLLNPTLLGNLFGVPADCYLWGRHGSHPSQRRSQVIQRHIKSKGMSLAQLLGEFVSSPNIGLGVRGREELGLRKNVGAHLVSEIIQPFLSKTVSSVSFAGIQEKAQQGEQLNLGMARSGWSFRTRCSGD